MRTDLSHRKPPPQMGSAAMSPRLRILPIAVGGVVLDLLATSLLTHFVLRGLLSLALDGSSPEPGLPHLLIDGAQAVFWLGLTVGVGFVVGRWAGFAERRHAAWAGAVSACALLLMTIAKGAALGDATPASLVGYAVLALKVPLAYAGGALAARRRARRRPEHPDRAVGT